MCPILTALLFVLGYATLLCLLLHSELWFLKFWCMPVLPSRVFVLLFFVVKFSCMDVSFVFVCLLTRRLRELVPEQAKSHASTTRLPHRFRYCSNSGFPFLLLLIIITLTLTLAIRIPLLFAKSWRRLWWAPRVGCLRCWTRSLQPQQLSFLLWSIVDSKILADETDDNNWCILFLATPKLGEDKVRQCVDTKTRRRIPTQSYY